MLAVRYTNIKAAAAARLKWDEASFQLKPTPYCSSSGVPHSRFHCNPFITCSSLIHFAWFSQLSFLFSRFYVFGLWSYPRSTALYALIHDETDAHDGPVPVTCVRVCNMGLRLNPHPWFQQAALQGLASRCKKRLQRRGQQSFMLPSFCKLKKWFVSGFPLDIDARKLDCWVFKSDFSQIHPEASV